MDFVMLDFSFDVHTVLWALDKQKFLILRFLDVRRSVKCLISHKKILCLN